MRHFTIYVRSSSSVVKIFRVLFHSLPVRPHMTSPSEMLKVVIQGLQSTFQTSE